MEQETIVLEMVIIEPATVMEAFINGDALTDAIDQVKNVVSGFDHDMTTKAGRDRTRSFAAKIPKVKTALAKMGRDLTADWKAKSKLVDSSIKSMSESIDEQRDIARQPLTDWEAAEDKKKADKEAAEEAEKLAVQFENDHDYALLMNQQRDREAIEAKAEAERQAAANAEFDARLQAEREARLIAEAAQKATLEASEQAARKDAEAALAVKTAQEAEQKAKRDHEDALARAESLRVQAVKDAEDKAEREALAKENARIAEEQRVQAEQEARAANTAHCREINNAVLADMVAAGLDEVTAKKLIGLIAKGKISHTQIQY